MREFLGALASAQIPVEVNLSSILVFYGPMGGMIVWFMWRFEKMITEIRRLGHRFDGMTRALLVDTIDRESSTPFVRDHARKMLSEIEERDRSSRKRDRY